MNQIPVGSTAASAPSDVAINPATGMAVVANKGSNDISLIDLIRLPALSLPPARSRGSRQHLHGCRRRGSYGRASGCPPSGPTSVSVDYVRNIALVVNATSKTIAVVDLNAQAVTSVLPSRPGRGHDGHSSGVGINPVTGRALVAMQARNYGVLVDVTQNPPVFAGIVSISTGANTRVAVEPHLNWALATPGSSRLLGNRGLEPAIEQRDYRYFPDE